MEEYSSGSDSDYSKYWVDWFLGTKGNEYFCEVDEDFIIDRFNLTGLSSEVGYYQYALDIILDQFTRECDDKMKDTIEKSARHLYGLIHARYILTAHGLQKMIEKYKKSDFGKCPRVLCNLNPLLPLGQADQPHVSPVKLYCPSCEDIYNPKSSRHSAIDGAYFGSTFPHMLFQVYPAFIPSKPIDIYIPKIYGFKVHERAKLARWRLKKRDEMLERVKVYEEEEEEREKRLSKIGI